MAQGKQRQWPHRPHIPVEGSPADAWERLAQLASHDSFLHWFRSRCVSLHSHVLWDCEGRRSGQAACNPLSMSVGLYTGSRHMSLQAKLVYFYLLKRRPPRGFLVSACRMPRCISHWAEMSEAAYWKLHSRLMACGAVRRARSEIPWEGLDEIRSWEPRHRWRSGPTLRSLATKWGVPFQDVKRIADGELHKGIDHTPNLFYEHSQSALREHLESRLQALEAERRRTSSALSSLSRATGVPPKADF